MSIISTKHKLVGVQNGGTVSGAVRYDVKQDLTEAEQLQARENIGIKGLGQEYSAGNNIDITDHVISVTGKKLLTIDDVSMTATQTDNTINIGVNNDYYQNLTQIAVDNAVEEIITEGRVIHEVYHDNSLTGNGNDKPLGLANDYALASDFEALQGDVETIDNLVTTINNEVDQNIIDIGSLSAQNVSLDVRVASNTSNITTNTTNISTVTRKADDTWQYIVDHESVWGASLNVNSPLTGTGSTASPLGINALKIDATLTGDGYNTKIGLKDNYALQSNLNTTNQTVLSHSDEIYNLGNDLNECQQDIESVSAMVPEIRWTGMGSASADKLHFTQQFDPVTEEYVQMDYDSTSRGLGYTLSDAGRTKLTNAATVDDLGGKQDKLTAGYGISINEINQISNTMHVETFSTILSRHTLVNTGSNDINLGNWRLHFTHKAVTSWGSIGTNMTVRTVKSLQYGDSGEAQYHIVQNHWRQQATNKSTWPAPFKSMHGKFADGEVESYNSWANDVTLGKDGYNFIYEGPEQSKATIWHFFVDCGYKWSDWLDFWVQLYYVNQNQPNSNAVHMKIYGIYHYA